MYTILLLGTLGYVMSEVEDGKPLSQVVRAAKSLGYTEPGY
jgi:homoserine dehydrogenase